MQQKEMKRQIKKLAFSYSSEIVFIGNIYF
jgi:hypothetical protein